MNFFIKLNYAVSVLLFTLPLLYSVSVCAAEKPVPLKAEDILKLLQDEGLINRAQVKKIRAIAKDRITHENQTPVEYISKSQKDKPPASQVGIVRVPYIPKYIENEIRDDVRQGLKQDVIGEVMAKARKESWGIPGTNPLWTKRIKFNGDIRFRLDSEHMDSGNSIQYRNFNAINAAGGTTGAGINAFINSRKNRDRLRLRFRFGMKVKITKGLSVGMRIATGNPKDPVSTNQTLDGYGGRYSIALDRAYLNFHSLNKRYKLYLGRMPNPWLSSSQLVWDKDLNFDGAAFSYYFNRSRISHHFSPFITVGAFSLQEVKLSSQDKWLLGGQTGFSYLSDNHNRFKAGLAYYNFIHIVGIKNRPDSNLNDFTAPPFVQKGNTMFDISNSTTNVQIERWALASEFKEVNLSLLYDMVNFSPVHVIIAADYVKNIGFNQAQIRSRTGGSVARKTTGYNLKIKVGQPTLLKPGSWNVKLDYRYLERDAVVDAFTDSDFHLGGTDGKGYKLSFGYGIERDTWLKLELISANAIDGPPLGILTILADVNAKF